MMFYWFRLTPEVLPAEQPPFCNLTPNIQLNIPIVSAAMDTVTEAELAIGMALEGGLGFIHKSMSIEQQANQVRKIETLAKRHDTRPVTLSINSLVRDAEKIMREYKIGGIPVVNEMVNSRASSQTVIYAFIKHEHARARHHDESNLITAPENITLQQAEGILSKSIVLKLPIVNKKGLLVGLITYKDILKKKEQTQCVSG